MTTEEIAREYAGKWASNDPDYDYVEEVILAAIERAQSEDKARLDWLEGSLNQLNLFGNFLEGGSPKELRNAIDRSRRRLS